MDYEEKKEKEQEAAMSPQTVLIVEDEQDIRDLLAYNLGREGFGVLEASTGAHGVALAGEKLPDVILLDLMLPEMDGLGVCKALQRDARTAGIPVIMLTAKGEEIDRIVGLELGAADYIVKPFSLREVALRIRSVLRRSEATSDVTVLQCGPVRLDTASHVATVNGVPIELTVTEFRLLADLLRHVGKARSREQLLAAVWDHAFEGYARTVDTHVKRLRAKLGAGAGLIETVRGIGYRMKEAA